MLWTGRKGELVLLFLGQNMTMPCAECDAAGILLYAVLKVQGHMRLLGPTMDNEMI